MYRPPSSIFLPWPSVGYRVSSTGAQLEFQRQVDTCTVNGFPTRSRSFWSVSWDTWWRLVTPGWWHLDGLLGRCAGWRRWNGERRCSTNDCYRLRTWKWPSRNSGFSHWKLWFSTDMLNDQRVCSTMFNYVQLCSTPNLWLVPSGVLETTFPAPLGNTVVWNGWW